MLAARMTAKQSQYPTAWSVAFIIVKDAAAKEYVLSAEQDSGSKATTAVLSAGQASDNTVNVNL